MFPKLSRLNSIGHLKDKFREFSGEKVEKLFSKMPYRLQYYRAVNKIDSQLSTNQNSSFAKTGFKDLKKAAKVLAILTGGLYAVSDRSIVNFPDDVRGLYNGSPEMKAALRDLSEYISKYFEDLSQNIDESIPEYYKDERVNKKGLPIFDEASDLWLMPRSDDDNPSEIETSPLRELNGDSDQGRATPLINDNQLG